MSEIFAKKKCKKKKELKNPKRKERRMAMRRGRGEELSSLSKRALVDVRTTPMNNTATDFNSSVAEMRYIRVKPDNFASIPFDMGGGVGPSFNFRLDGVMAQPGLWLDPMNFNLFLQWNMYDTVQYPAAPLVALIPGAIAQNTIWMPFHSLLLFKSGTFWLNDTQITHLSNTNLPFTAFHLISLLEGFTEMRGAGRPMTYPTGIISPAVESIADRNFPSIWEEVGLTNWDYNTLQNDLGAFTQIVRMKDLFPLFQSPYFLPASANIVIQLDKHDVNNVGYTNVAGGGVVPYQWPSSARHRPCSPEV